MYGDIETLSLGKEKKVIDSKSFKCFLGCAVLAFFCFIGCANIDSAKVGSVEYGSISLSLSGGGEKSAVTTDAIKSCIVTVEGYDAGGKAYCRTSGAVEVVNGVASDVFVNLIPVSKNAVVSVSAFSDSSASVIIDGVSLYAVTDIVAGENYVMVDSNSSVKGKICKVLIDSSINVAVSDLSGIDSLVEDFVKNSISYTKIDAVLIAKDFPSALKSYDKYIINEFEGYRIHVYNSSWSGAHNIYAYPNDKSLFGTWPGSEMSKEAEGYVIETEKEISGVNLIFNCDGNYQYPANGSSEKVIMPSGLKEAWFDLSSKTWKLVNPLQPSKPTVSISPYGGSVQLDGSVSVTISANNGVLSGASVIVSGAVSKTYSLNDFVNGKLVISVSDLGIFAEGVSFSVKANATNEAGTCADVSASFVTSEVSEKAANWNELRIYQVMVASFQDGDSSIGYYQMWGPDNQLKGGDLQGVINAIDYIKDLGCNAIWMTPIFESNGDGKLDATGYFASDYFNIDHHFGTMEKFDELVAKCHENGIAVILDGVFGHNKGYVTPSPNRKGILNPGISPSTSNPVNYSSNENSLKYYSDVARYWITEHKIDGWRFDQCYQLGFGENAKAVASDNCDGCDRNHWYDIRKVIEAAAASNGTVGQDWGTLGYIVGEHWRGDAATIQKGSVEGGSAPGYGLNGCFDFPSYYQLVQGFAQEWGGKTTGNIGAALSYTYQTYTEKGYSCKDDDGKYDTYYPNLMLSNHDLFRVGDLINKKHGDDFDSENYAKRNMVLLAAQGAYSGPITIYYGDEIGDHNATTTNGWSSDNVARSSGKITGFNTREQKIHDFEKKVLNARAEHEALWNGVNKTITSSNDFYVAKKTAGKETVYIAFNYNASSSKTFQASGVDLLTGNSFNGTVTVPALSAVYILEN